MGLPGLTEDAELPFNRAALTAQTTRLAQRAVFIGTSSWKYPGWCGTLYDRSRYERRGKFAEARFNKECIAEYGEVFKTVCVDAAYYTFPTRHYLESMAGQVPADFLFAFKVTDAVTLKHFPNLPRFADAAGKPNPNYLNSELFIESFLSPCETIRPRVGLLMFEFSRFWPFDYAHGRDFVTQLDAFLSRLPKGWPYAVEIRNRNWLRPDYFHCLGRHSVTHILNSWEAMPPVTEQMALPGWRTNPDLIAARFLLKPGRTYEEAVKAFAPYDQLKEEYPEARLAARKLIAENKTTDHPKRRTFIFVNNRLEGHALRTIGAILQEP